MLASRENFYISQFRKSTKQKNDGGAQRIFNRLKSVPYGNTKILQKLLVCEFVPSRAKMNFILAHKTKFLTINSTSPFTFFSHFRILIANEKGAPIPRELTTSLTSLHRAYLASQDYKPQSKLYFLKNL